jgi:hypothetical protein
MNGFDINMVEVILVSGIGGVGVRAITAWLKTKLVVKGFVAYLLSLGVCAAATAAYLVPMGWNTTLFVMYTAFVFASANGIYRATKKS